MDESATSAVAVTRTFSKLKNRLMPYLYTVAAEASDRGIPVLRPMLLEFPDDPTVAHLDRQYMLGPDLLVAPVFSASGDVSFYLPAGTWTNLLTGDRVAGGGWHHETHAFDSLPLYVRQGAVLPIGGRDDRPDYDYLEGLTVHVYPGASGAPVPVVTPDGVRVEIELTPDGAGGFVASAGGKSIAVVGR